MYIIPFWCLIKYKKWYILTDGYIPYNNNYLILPNVSITKYYRSVLFLSNLLSYVNLYKRYSVALNNIATCVIFINLFFILLNYIMNFFSSR